MALNIGDPAPQITGTDIVGNKPWSLDDHAPKTVLLVFSGITWCAPCQEEVPALEAVWQQLKGNWSFTMAIISGMFGAAEKPQTLQNAIAQFGITFPVILGDESWPTYNIGGVPTLYCLQWDAENTRYEVHGVNVGSLNGEQAILEFLIDCGLDEQPKLPVGNWEAVLMHVVGGVIVGGSGWGITAGGKPIPIPPPLRQLGPAGRDALLGLAIAEMASHFSDSELRKRVREAGIGAAKEAVSRLEARNNRSLRGGVSMEPSAWGPERVPTSEKQPG